MLVEEALLMAPSDLHRFFVMALAALSIFRNFLVEDSHHRDREIDYLMSRKFAAAMLLIWAGCMGDAQPSEDPDLSSAVQELQTCTNSCAWPQYNGVPVSCSTNTYCLSTGQGVFCDGGATVLCSKCGNGTCEAGESSSNCLADCSVCGDGQCTGSEDEYSCAVDCSYCGDGICSGSETRYSCVTDCGPCWNLASRGDESPDLPPCWPNY